MCLELIKVVNFRNISGIKLEADKGINLLLGENGEGKTNFLESLFYIGNLKCVRTSYPEKCIKRGREAFALEGVKQNKKYRVTYSKNRKEIEINGKKTTSLEYLKTLTIIGFFPQEEVKVFSSPSKMRELIDRGIFYIDKIYLKIYREFIKLLQERNTLLKSGYFDKSLFDVLTDLYLKRAIEIEERREEFIAKISPYVKKVFTAISGGEWKMDITYERSDYSFIGTITEKERGYTISGPHRGKVELLVNDNSLREYGSQGQVKTVLLAYKLAVIRMVSERGDKPIFLADDIGGELDKKRREALFSFLKGENIQSFITSAIDIDIREGKTFKVEKGKIWELY